MDTVKDVTVYPTPFVKPHCVLIVADATVLLINRRLAHTDVRLQKHAGMFCASRTSVCAKRPVMSKTVASATISTQCGFTNGAS